MTKRVPAQPPKLPGFEFISLIGSGGYADVFLYEQHAPNRRVAVKVVDPTVLPGGMGQQNFTAEANLMAKVSAHPYIVQVFQTDIAPDGRPYLVMEYYPGPNFYDRARTEQITVAEALRVGVQLASAVETAHRAGILHRDIKPANVLTSEYWRPGLTDFGIAAVQGPGIDTADGVSIPWSPPEALGDTPADRRGDVYSLAATIYTLVAGRSPFEIPGGDNRHLALIGRIERHPVPAIGRADVPASLERVLATAMAKDPVHRPGTAAELGRQFQAVESELRLAVTALELAEEQRNVRARTDVVDDDSTRVKGVKEVHAQGAASPMAAPSAPSVPIAAVPSAPASAGFTPDRRREGLLAEPELTDTVMRPARTADDSEPAVASGTERSRALTVGAVAAGVVALAIGGFAVLRPGGDDTADTPSIAETEINDEFSTVAAPPSPVPAVEGRQADDGRYVFTWDDLGAGFAYMVTPDGGDPEQIADATFRSTERCIEVEVVADATGLISAPTQGCAS